MQPGTRLAHYEIISAIGKGGMGEVWKAKDSKLGREVAIKTLPLELEQQEAWVARFEREAKVLASLNHPNIAAIHGFDRDQSQYFLVLEFVGGETLAERLTRGPIPLDEAFGIARQIADALDAAHQNGVVHRDLKPANIKITDDGIVKVLDFGLARTLWSEESVDPAQSPTINLDVSLEGLIVGTAAYMAPEQARGKRVDKRADIWAFGVVLYEMITGRRLFEGTDLTETLASVVLKTPDFQTVPSQVRWLIRKCLERDPKNRLRDIADAVLLLGDPAVEAQAAPRTKRGSKLPWIAAALLALPAIAFALLMLRRPEALPQVVRFEVYPPAGATLPMGTPAVSPDGKSLAYVVREADGSSRLHIRPIDRVETRSLPGTDGAVHPFWSPNGLSLAFATGVGRLKRIDLAGGDARVLTGAGGPWHGAWNQTGDMLVLRSGEILRVPDQGGEGTPLEGGSRDTFPTFLSDGKRFLVRTITDQGSSIRLGMLGSEDRKIVLENVLSAPILAPTPIGKTYLLYLRDADLMAQPFDEVAGSVIGEPLVLLRRVGRVANPAVMPTVGVSKTVLAYQSGDEAPIGQLTWFRRDGKPMDTLPAELAVQNPTLAADDSKVVGDRPSGGRDIWVVDLGRKTTTRITFDNTLDSLAVWSNDFKRIAFNRAEKGILVVNADGSGTPEVLTTEGNPTSWSPDGKFLLYTEDFKIWMLEIAARKVTRVGSANGTAGSGQFSPDGKYIVYVANETGRAEVFVEAVPPLSGRVRVSLNGGTLPRWRRNGKELFFVSGDNKMMAAQVTLGESLSASEPRELFPFTGRTNYAVTSDGQRFLILTPPKELDAPINVVLNWWVELERNLQNQDR